MPLATLKARIDKRGELRTVIVTLTGDETLLHPDIIEFVPQIRSPFMVPEDLRYETKMLREPRIKRDHAPVFFRPHPKGPDVERTKQTLGSDNAKTVIELWI